TQIALHETDRLGNLRVPGEAVELWLVGVLEHGDHARAADAGRIVQTGVDVPVRLELLDPFVAHRLHVRLGAEVQAAGGTGLHTGRLEAHAGPVHAERALGHLPGLLREARHVERTAGLAQTAPDALIRVHVDDAVGVLDDRARRRAGLEAARIRAVHALVLAHQPVEAPIHVHFVELDQVPDVRGHGGERLVAPVLDRLGVRKIVPLLARHLAGLAPDAGGGIDELADHGQLAQCRAGAAERRGRLEDLESGDRHGQALPSDFLAGSPWSPLLLFSPVSAFSSWTWNALYSGVQVLGSIAQEVTRFASGPACLAAPLNPQWIGKPICQTRFPSRSKWGIRRVTIAGPLMVARAELIRTMSPFLIPFSFASSSGISKKMPGWTSLSRPPSWCLVQWWKCSVRR